MNRSVEIIAILRKGMEKMLSKDENLRVNYTRIFNFNENRVSLRMEVAEPETPFTPMGRIDVVELPTNNGRITCNCTLTELQTGQSRRILLRLKDSQERERECEKVFGFFRKILSLPDDNLVSQPVIPVHPPKADGSDSGLGNGSSLDWSRGAQLKEDKPND